MATITGLTADRMLAIEAASVVDGDVVGDDLILTTKGGQQINAGNVRGPEGDQGPVGSDLVVVSSKQILDVGLSGQIRAGRQLTATDFTNMGLAAPLGLWTLSNLNDSSGNGRNLSNKGAVPFTTGIEGVASSAAQFAGLTTQTLYISDTGVNDPFRIKTGSWGCWFKGSKRSVNPQSTLIGKIGAPGQYGWELHITLQNTASVGISPDGTAFAAASGASDVMDNRWHFVVGTCDGASLCIYVDGVLENTNTSGGVIFGSSATFNIGSRGGDASVAAGYSHFGQIDEAFVTSEILSEDQIRNLYCVKIPHILSAVPKNVGLNVRRRKKGAALASGDFPTQPLRLYNFSAGSLNDEGSNGQVLINNAAAISVPGVDGSLGNAFNFVSTSNQYLSATDTGLPMGTTPRSIGCWAKLPNIPNVNGCFVTYGAVTGTSDIRIDMWAVIRGLNGASYVASQLPTDSAWHFVVFVQDNSAMDGVKSKLYIDGRFVIGDTANLVSITAGGANKFRIGSDVDNGATSRLTGQIDSVFVCGYALDAMHIAALYAKGSQVLGLSPKNSGDHVELMTNTDLFCTFDTLPSQHQIDLVVA